MEFVSRDVDTNAAKSEFGPRLLNFPLALTVIAADCIYEPRLDWSAFVGCIVRAT